MELKDNVALSNLPLFSRYASASNPADLLGSDNSGDAKISFADTIREHQSKSASAATAKKPVDKESIVENKASDKEAPVKKEAKEKTTKTKASNEEKTSSSVSSNKDVKENTAAPAKEANASSPAEDRTIVSENENISNPDAKEFKFDDLEAIAAIPALIITNNVTGESWKMSGQEYLDNIEMFKDIPNITVTVLDEQGSPVLEFAGLLDKLGNIVSDTEEVLNPAPVVKNEKVEAPADLDVAVPEVALEDEAVLSKQAAKIAEVVGEDKKVKVEVTNKENKTVVANPVAKPFVVEIETAEEAPQFVTEKTLSSMISQKPIEKEATVADVMLNNTETAEMPTQPQAPVAQVAVQEAPVVASKVAIENISTVSTASVSGAEFAASAKPLTAAEAKSQIQDTYKGMSREVVEQVKVNITKQAVKGIDKIDIQLKPEGLGKVEVNLHIGKDGKLQANITANRIDALDVLQKDAATLEKALNDAGFNTDEGSLSFSLREDQNNQNKDDSLRNFMSKALEIQEDIQPDLLAETVWDGKSALNIKV